MSGGTSYEVFFDGDGALYPASHIVMAVSVTVHDAQLTLTPDQSSYAAGDTARVHVDLADSSNHQVEVDWLDVRTGANGVLYQGVVPDGGIDVKHKVSGTTRFVAASPTTTTQNGDTESVDVGVRLGLRVRMLEPRRTTAGGVAIYDAPARPRARVVSSPHRAGACVRLSLQRKGPHGWSFLGSSSCHTLAADGTSTWHLRKGMRAGSYRVRGVFAGDASNLASTSAWERLRLR